MAKKPQTPIEYRWFNNYIFPACKDLKETKLFWTQKSALFTGISVDLQEEKKPTIA